LIRSKTSEPECNTRGKGEDEYDFTEESVAGKTVVIGMGNRYMKDDGVGIEIADELEHRFLGENVLVRTCRTVDLTLLAHYGGASKLIIVDATVSGEPPGTISRYEIVPSKAPLFSLPGLHALQLHDMLDVACQMGLLACPVIMIGIEPKDCGGGEGMSGELAEVMPRVLSEVIREIGRT